MVYAISCITTYALGPIIIVCLTLPNLNKILTLQINLNGLWSPILSSSATHWKREGENNQLDRGEREGTDWERGETMHWVGKGTVRRGKGGGGGGVGEKRGQKTIREGKG